MNWTSPYTPQHHQERFHSLPHKEKLFLGGVGAGKTLTGIHETIFLMEDNPLCDGLISSPTFPMLRDVILPLWEEWIPKELYTHKKSDKCIIWHHTGKKIFLRSLDNPGSISGLNVGFAWADEPALLRTVEAWNILRARVGRNKDAKRPCIFGTTTPLGLNWLIKEFRKQISSMAVIRARTADNKHLQDDFEPGLRARFGTEYAKQYLDAMILELQGLAWPVFPQVHSNFKPAEARRKCKTFFGSVDWGHTNPAAIVIGGLDNDGRWYLVDSWYKRGLLRSDIAEQAGKMSKKWDVRRWWPDHDPDGIELMRREGCDTELAVKDVEAGVQHVRSLLAVRNDGQPRLHIGSWLKDWHRENDEYAFPEGKEEPEGGAGDHLLDATRYLTYSHEKLWIGKLDYSTVSQGRMKKQDRSWSKAS